MKEDILEQLVEDWLVSESGWFVKHNLKFRPDPGCEGYESKKDSVHSDIDILALSGVKTGVERVALITCKSWQDGFSPRTWIAKLEAEASYHEPSVAFKAREEWKSFRELVSLKWMKAFVSQVERETGQRDFTYIVAVTKTTGRPEERSRFENSTIIRDRFRSIGSEMELKIVTLEEIIKQYLLRLRNKVTPSLESTDVGRLLQLMAAAKIDLGVGELVAARSTDVEAPAGAVRAG